MLFLETLHLYKSPISTLNHWLTIFTLPSGCQVIEILWHASICQPDFGALVSPCWASKVNACQKWRYRIKDEIVCQEELVKGKPSASQHLTHLTKMLLSKIDSPIWLYFLKNNFLTFCRIVFPRVLAAYAGRNSGRASWSYQSRSWRTWIWPNCSLLGSALNGRVKYCLLHGLVLLFRYPSIWFIWDHELGYPLIDYRCWTYDNL